MKILFFLFALASSFTVQAQTKCSNQCKQWFDGCNVCECQNGQTIRCTEMACETRRPSGCIHPKKQNEMALIARNSDCERWFDGCNVCFYKNGQKQNCTEKKCSVFKKARCLQAKLKQTLPSPSKHFMLLKIPLACEKWYDGCNVCLAKNGKLTGCLTMKSCLVRHNAYCIKWKTKNEVKSLCSLGCKRWFNGCNVCECQNGKALRCTEMPCPKQIGVAKCVAYHARKCPTNCKLWFDGCNQRACLNGNLQGNKPSKCKASIKPYCIQSDD